MFACLPSLWYAGAMTNIEIDIDNLKGEIFALLHKMGMLKFGELRLNLPDVPVMQLSDALDQLLLEKIIAWDGKNFWLMER